MASKAGGAIKNTAESIADSVSNGVNTVKEKKKSTSDTLSVPEGGFVPKDITADNKQSLSGTTQATTISSVPPVSSEPGQTKSSYTRVKFCQKCGEPLDEGSTFCKVCNEDAFSPASEPAIIQKPTVKNGIFNNTFNCPGCGRETVPPFFVLHALLFTSPRPALPCKRSLSQVQPPQCIHSPFS